MSVATNSAIASKFDAAKLGLIFIIACVIAGLAAFDWWLAATEKAEMQKSAERAYRNGMDLLRSGRTAEAVDALRTAHALERGNEQYELGLIEALMAAGKTSEAEPLMNEVLQQKPNDGFANLIAARLMSKKGQFRDAEAFYHRAMYGEWPDNAGTHRIAARMELIQLLQSHDNQEELLAEVIPLEQEATNNEPLQLKLAHLLLVSGSPSRAAELYHAMLERNPGNVAKRLYRSSKRKRIPCPKIATIFGLPALSTAECHC
jgi:thioredoxin-like negative regulator of GroEL